METAEMYLVDTNNVLFNESLENNGFVKGVLQIDETSTEALFNIEGVGFAFLFNFIAKIKEVKDSSKQGVFLAYDSSYYQFSPFKPERVVIRR